MKKLFLTLSILFFTFMISSCQDSHDFETEERPLDVSEYETFILFEECELQNTEEFLNTLPEYRYEHFVKYTECNDYLFNNGTKTTVASDWTKDCSLLETVLVHDIYLFSRPSEKNSSENNSKTLFCVARDSKFFIATNVYQYSYSTISKGGSTITYKDVDYNIHLYNIETQTDVNTYINGEFALSLMEKQLHTLQKIMKYVYIPTEFQNQPDIPLTLFLVGCLLTPTEA